MELDLGPEIAQFRTELREWIAREAPEGLAGLADWNMAASGGARRAPRMAEALASPLYAEWDRRLSAARLICPQSSELFLGDGAYHRERLAQRIGL